MTNEQRAKVFFDKQMETLAKGMKEEERIKKIVIAEID